jgi:LCP family protein required for cell wall assembly
MANKYRSSKAPRSIDGMRIKSTGVVPKSNKSFPVVGMTLPTYPRPKVALPPRRINSFTTDQTHEKGLLRRILSFKHIFITVLCLGIIIGGYVGGTFLYNTHKLFGGSIFGVFSSTTLKGQSSGRVTILLAGNSADDPGHNGADLTDSILLMSINTNTKQAFLLSVPRDLFVNIPGAGYQKINDAYVVGQNDSFNQSGYFSGGMGLLQSIVEKDFGIPIDYYALINYAALKDAVNDVGGITINIQSSDPRGLYDPSVDYATGGPLVRLTNGEHILDGEQALDLARARGDAYGSYGFAESDFERTANQREMLIALKQKAETAGVLANPVKLAGLFNAIGGNVSTDLTLSDVRALYSLTKTETGSSIASLSLNDADGVNLLQNYDSDGQDALPASMITVKYNNMFSKLRQTIRLSKKVPQSSS